MRVHNVHTLLITHRDPQQHTNMPNITNKRIMQKIITPKQIRFLSEEAFSLCSCKFRLVNSESAMVQAQLTFIGIGWWDSDWFIADYAPKHTHDLLWE